MQNDNIAVDNEIVVWENPSTHIIQGKCVPFQHNTCLIYLGVTEWQREEKSVDDNSIWLHNWPDRGIVSVC